MIGDIVGGAVGGGIVALLTRDGHIITDASKRSVRRYRGYPSDTDTSYALGNAPLVVGPPEGYAWEILAMHWYIAYSALGAGGIPVINIYDRSDRLLLPLFHPPRAVGVTVWNYYTQGASYPEFAIAANAGVVYPLPLNGELKDEYLVFDAQGGALDAHRVFVYFEEYRL